MAKPIIIGVDMRDLRVGKTGTRTYLAEICKEFKKLNSHEVRFHFLDSVFPVYTGNKKLLKILGHISFQTWKQFTLPLKALFKGCDIVFCTDHFVPLINLGYKTIPVFHDAFFFESPESYGKIWLWFYKKTAIPAANKSPFIITPSFYSKKQIIKLMGIPAGKLRVIYEGPKTSDIDATDANTEQLLKKYSLSKQNYLLHAGAFYKRKNMPALINAFIKLKGPAYPNLKLVLAGPLPTNKIDSDYQLILDIIERYDLQNEVVITGYLPDELLLQLYKNALMYVFPSVNEGFGIPVLEAFKNDLPALIANNTCLPEIGGDAVLQFDPFDIDDIAVKIKTVLDDAELQKEMIRRGRERLKLFSWQNTAGQLVEVFKKAV